MPNCPKCNKPVYFAEKKTSLGKDWHSACLRCCNASCNKTLTPGNHDEVVWFRNNYVSIRGNDRTIRLTMTNFENLVCKENSKGITVDLNRAFFYDQSSKQSQHEGKPYCHTCYSALYGPKGYGHGGTESHTFHGGKTG